MSNIKVLFPYNFSRHDRKALDLFIETFSPHKDAEIVLFHIHPPLPKLDMGTAPVMDRMKTGIQYLAEDLTKKEDELGTVKNYLADKGFSKENISCVFRPRAKDIADEIAEAAVSGYFNMVVLAHSRDKATRLFAKSIYAKIIPQLKGVSAFVVT